MNDNINKPNLNLTRFLYPKDEVEISLLIALLQKKPLNECIFWACELIYSGFDITQLIWSIYYDFYAQLNPNLFHKVSNALECMRQSGNTEPLFILLKTLRVRPATDNVFSLRISQTPTKFTIYRGRVPGWLSQYPQTHRPLLRAICTYDWNQIMRFINNKVGEPKQLLNSILRIMLEKNMIEMKGGESSEEHEIPNIIDAHWDNHGYTDDFHIILALVVSLITPDKQIDFSCKGIKLNDAEKAFVAELNAPLVPNCYTYATLLMKRIYCINPFISAFDIRANQNENNKCSKLDFINEISEFWVYHCCQTPYWQNEFQKVDGVVNSRGELVFIEDDGDENKFRTFDLLHGYCYNIDEPFAREMWLRTCSYNDCDKDVVDVMEDIFSEDEKELRMEFDELLLSTDKRSYCSGNSNSNTFDFTLLNQLLDSI